MPVALTSRADNVRMRIGSAAVAKLLAHRRRAASPARRPARVSDAGSLLVLNAGSSSVKFCTFEVGPDRPVPRPRRPVAPDGDDVRLVVRRRGETLADRSLGTARLDHASALAALARLP